VASSSRSAFLVFLLGAAEALGSLGAPSALAATNLALPAGVVLVAQGASSEGSAVAFKYRFPNGLRLIVVPDDRNPVATLRTMLDAGSNREVPGRTGLAHFFEHMMFRKTRSQEEGHFDRTLAGVGGNGNASTSTDYVSYESTFPGPALDTMLDLERDRLRDLDLQDPYFSTEKGAVNSERSLRYDNDPNARAGEILRRAIEKGTPYEWLTIGLRADIVSMRIADARAFYTDFYTPDNTVVSVGGPFRPEAVVRKVFERLGNWQGKAAKSPVDFPKDYTTRLAGKEFFCGESVFQKTANVVFPSDDSSYEAMVNTLALNQLLATHKEGSLAYRLSRRKIAMSGSLYKTTWQKRFQPYVVSFRMTPEQTSTAAEKFFWKALDEALERPIDAAFRASLKKQLAVEEADTALRMSSLVQLHEWNEYFYGDFLASRQAKPLVEALETEKFRAWVKQTFVKDKAYRYGVFPKDGATPCDRWKEE